MAHSECAAAVAAARLAGIDAAVLTDAGLDDEAAADVLRRSIAQWADVLPAPLPTALAAAAGDLPAADAATAGRLADLFDGEEPAGFAAVLERLADAPRAGATRPGAARLILTPEESHADHCYLVAVYAVLLAPLYRADPATVFLASLSHHFHNAHLPDAGFTGEELLGAHLAAVMDGVHGPLPRRTARPAGRRGAGSPDDPAGRLHAGGPLLPRRGRAGPRHPDGLLRPGRQVHHAAGAGGFGPGASGPGAGVPRRGADGGGAVVVNATTPASPSPLGGAESDMLSPGGFPSREEEWRYHFGELFPAGLLDPQTRGRLVVEISEENAKGGLLSDSDRGDQWPLIGRVPYLRVGRDDLRWRAEQCWGWSFDPETDADRGLGAGADGAGPLLLTDRDDFAPGDPPPLEDAARVSAGGTSLREAMGLLGYGPVAHYFAHRPAVPTFLSGLSLLALASPTGDGVLELCCGTGHFLRHLAGRQGPATGSDVVFSKLFLANRYVCDDAAYLCCDASAAPVPLPDGTGQTVFCHDALYFLPDKSHVLREMKRLAGPGGCVLVGHAHNSAADHGDVAGTPRTPAEYRALFEEAGMPGPDLYDDAELAESCLSHAKPQARSAEDLASCEAIAAVWPGGGGHWDPSLTLPAPGTPLSVNPLLIEQDGVLKPNWPMPRFAEEYRSATYLTHEIRPDERPVIEAARESPVPFDAADPVVERLARRRVLLDVPEGW